MTRRIVVPLDGSELSERILAHVRRLLVREDCPVTLVRVLPDAGADAVDAAQRHLDRLVNALRAQGATASSEVLVGPPAERILGFADEKGASLIAMATHGRTGFSRWLRGSTTERVLRASKVPLLVANPFGLGEGAAAEVRFRRILVPLDLSERSAQVLPLVREIARLYESEVILLHVIEVPAPLEYPVSFERLTGADAENALAATARTLEGIRVFTATEVGPAARAILAKADQDGVDLIALATHGRSGPSRWAFGSVAEQVVRNAACPLLVVRTTTGSD